MSPAWDTAQYLRFADERQRPALELLARVPVDAERIVDLGCGAGSTLPALRERWPRAALVGVDSSAPMLERAAGPAHSVGATLVHEDAASWRPAEPVDVVFANALLQWLPEQDAVLRALAEHVRPGGAIAVQVPFHGDAPSHALLRDLAAREPYAAHTRSAPQVQGVPAAHYLSLFAALGWDVDAWETTYLHVLAGPDPVFEWVRGTGARPVLEALPPDLADVFAAEYRAALREAYSPRSFGTVLPFRRTFCVAVRPAT